MPKTRSVPARMFAGIFEFTSFLGEIWCAAAKRLGLFLFGLIRYPLLFLWRLTLFACRSVSASLKSSLGDNRYFSGRILRALKTLTVTMFSSPKSVSALFGYYAKRARLRYRQPVQYLILLLLPLAAGAMLAVTVHHYGDLRLGLQVSAGETVLGCVSSENTFLSAKREAESLLAGDGTQWPEISYVLRLITANAFTDEETLRERLLQTAETKTVPACGVYIDGEFLCAVKNGNDARAVFTDLLYENAPEDSAATVGFIQNIEYVEGAYPETENTLWTKSQLKDYLTGLTGENALHVTVTHTETKNVSVPYSTVEIQSDALYIGTSRVVVQGQKGTDQVTSLVTLVDGETIRSQELLRYKLRDPVDAQVQVGTRALDSSFVQSSTSYGGVLIWPAIGANHINSDYEWRWGKLHGALDIGTSGSGSSLGKLVVAAAEGTVVVAGTHSSYGYYVKIDHGNGMQTLYAHCMAGSLMVSPGDHVDAGAPIARIGMTGYATGPHLHFEVIINGNRVDPKPYLGIG